MPRHIIKVERGSKLEKVINHRKAYGGAESQENPRAELFETKIRQAILRAFEGVPVNVLADEEGQMDFALHKGRRYDSSGTFLSPDAVIAGNGFHLPVEVKLLEANRRKKMMERFKQRIIPKVKRYAGSHLFTRLQMEDFIEHDSPPSKKAVLITNADIGKRAILDAIKNHKVHTIKISELEKLADHVPNLAAIDRRRVRKILITEKEKIMEWLDGNRA